MLRAALNKSWKAHLTNEGLYKRIPMVTETIRKQRMRFAGHCWRADNELASTVSGNLNTVNGNVDAQLRCILIYWLKIQNAP